MIVGADPSELRSLARQFRTSAQQLESVAGASDVFSLIRDFSELASKAVWEGLDGAAFMMAWYANLRPGLYKAAEGLRAGATSLERNAGEQERASDGGTAGRHGDKQGNPTLNPKVNGDYRTFPREVPFDDRALSPDDIRQGKIGDCYFIAVLRGLAVRDPQFIREHVWSNGDGTYTVKLYDHGKPVFITVDGSAPTGAASDGQGNPNWVTVYEKAFAEYMDGDYRHLEGGWNPEGDPEGDLTNGRTALEIVTGSNAQYVAHPSFDQIAEQLTHGPVAAPTPEHLGGSLSWIWGDPDTETRLVENHVYTVDRIENHYNSETGQSEMMIHVLNPWGEASGNDAADLWLTRSEFDKDFLGTYSLTSGNGGEQL